MKKAVMERNSYELLDDYLDAQIGAKARELALLQAVFISARKALRNYGVDNLEFASAMYELDSNCEIVKSFQESGGDEE
jgi:hypothetical protein